MQGQKIYKFIFIAHVHTVTLALKFPCVVSINWRRGQKVAEVKERKQIDRGVINFNEKLELQCNMVLNTKTNIFEQKKTKFTILIFSQKGNKQAGQVNLEVAEFINSRQKQTKIQKLLEKCPDKNAKLTLTLSAYMKEEVQPDAVSQKSNVSLTPEMLVINSSSIQQPDFKKKKIDVVPSQKKEGKQNQQNIEPAPVQQRIPLVNKANIQRMKLQQQNKKLKEQLNEMRQLEIENNALRKRLEQAEKKAYSYYSKKLQQVRKQYTESKQKAKAVEQMQSKKFELEKQMCQCKEYMGKILNYAITSGNNEMAQEIYNIYQNVKP